jgi:hypothetical protein
MVIEEVLLLATVPSENAFSSAVGTRPSGPRVTRSCATAGRRCT